MLIHLMKANLPLNPWMGIRKNSSVLYPCNSTSLWLDVALKVEVAVEGDLMCKFMQTAPLIPSYPARNPAFLKELSGQRFLFPMSAIPLHNSTSGSDNWSCLCETKRTSTEIPGLSLGSAATQQQQGWTFLSLAFTSN